MMNLPCGPAVADPPQTWEAALTLSGMNTEHRLLYWLSLGGWEHCCRSWKRWFWVLVYRIMWCRSKKAEVCFSVRAPLLVLFLQPCAIWSLQQLFSSLLSCDEVLQSFLIIICSIREEKSYFELRLFWYSCVLWKTDGWRAKTCRC